MRVRTILWLSVCAAAVGMAACSRPEPEQDRPVVRVWAAASLADALEEVCAAYARSGGARCELNLAASSLLARQIEQGGAADVFLSADRAWPERLASRGIVQLEPDAVFLSNALVVVVPEASSLRLRRLEDLADARVETIALGDPTHVPAGIYARAALERAGVWSRMQSKVVGALDVRAALAAVEQGAVDCGIVYRTDARASTRVHVALAVPPEVTPPIEYVAGLVRTEDAGIREEGRQLLAFLHSAEARAIFERLGFEVKRQ